MAVERLHAKNYDEFMDFINLVFSQDLIQVHFQEDMPLVFGPDEEHMKMQYAYRDETGRIRAAIGAIRYTYMVGDECFKAWTITNVATHYKHTGKGYMQAIFKEVFADMEAAGVTFTVLHGNRERYRHMGFEAAGITETAAFESYNIPSRKKKGEVYDFTFREVTQEDPALIEKCLALFNRETQRYVRTPEKFLDFQHMWEGKAYAVYNVQGEFCGYLNYYTRWGKAIRELELTCPEEAARVIYSFMQFIGENAFIVYTSPFDRVQNNAIYQAAEYVTSGQTTRMKLLQPERFLQACLEVKRRSGVYMPEGSLVVESPLGRLKIENKDGFRVAFTQEEAEITLTQDQVYQLFFGPDNRVFPLCSQKLGARSAWFPAPFYIHNTDLY